jgi:tetratricopeptide (TPR) repeat protein
MARLAQFLVGLLVLLGAVSVLVWAFWRALKSSAEPTQLLLRWLLTAGLLVAAYFIINPMMGDPLGQIAGVLTGAVFGLAIGAIWARALGEIVAKPFGMLYDGGDTPPDPEPFYSIAIAKRKQGRFHEALYDIQEQLARFPLDVTGQMLMAEIQAENLHDLAAAQLTVERFCQQPGHAPKNIAYALSTLADWQMKFAQDTDAARRALERIRELLPDTEEAQLAAQRLAHLAATGHLLASHDRAPIHVKEGAKDIGLMMVSSHLQRTEPDPAAQAAELVRHLEQHPLDGEAREKLALIYADHYQRLDLATDQLEQLVQQPHQPTKSVAGWLNLLADLHLKHAGDYDRAKAALERIVAFDPDAAAAEQARQRIAHLRLELKKNEKTQTLKLGTYEKDLGLKQAPPGDSNERQ